MNAQEIEKDEKEFEKYLVDKYIQIGLATDHITHRKAEKYLLPFYEKILKKQLPPIIIAPSPLAAWEQVRTQEVRTQIRDQELEDQVRQLEDQVWDHVEDQVEAQIRAQAGGAQVEEQVWTQVWAQVGAQVKDQTEDFRWPFLEGQFDASWGAWYAYYHEVMGVKFDCPAKEYHDLVNLSLIYPLEDVVVLSDKPAEIQRNNNGLHVLYRDGYSVYA